MTTKKPDELLSLIKQFAQSQRRQEVRMLLILSAVIAITTVTYAWTTWKSVTAIREGNEIQRQLLELQKGSAASKVALAPRRSEARLRNRQLNEAHNAPSRVLPGGEEQMSPRQAVIDSQAAPETGNKIPPTSRNWNARSAMLDRPGRQ